MVVVPHNTTTKGKATPMTPIFFLHTVTGLIAAGHEFHHGRPLTGPWIELDKEANDGR